MFEWKSWPGLVAAIAIALVAAVLIVVITGLITHHARKRREWARVLLSKARYPYRLLVVVAGLWIAAALTFPDPLWLRRIEHGFLIAAIVLATWLVGALLAYGLGFAVDRYDTDAADNRVARRSQTQLLIVRRLLVVIIVMIGLASVLLTFPGVQTLGVSVLASAGVVSVIAGLAAQSTLGNVFAGIQLAFSDAIRIQDVVVVNAQWGRIEEITLTYVVVRIWDDRRLVVPSTYFTTNPFENWTRTSSQLLGAVEFDLDWRVSTAAMREQLGVILKTTANWDGRTQVLQVTDAVGGFVHIRILVSAKDSPTLFDLRCYVRESMVDWVQRHNPQTMPRKRISISDDAGKPRGKDTPKTEEVGLFTGDAGEERASEFTAAVPVARNTPAGN